MHLLPVEPLGSFASAQCCNAGDCSLKADDGQAGGGGWAFPWPDGRQLTTLSVPRPPRGEDTSTFTKIMVVIGIVVTVAACAVRSAAPVAKELIASLAAVVITCNNDTRLACHGVMGSVMPGYELQHS